MTSGKKILQRCPGSTLWSMDINRLLLRPPGCGTVSQMTSEKLKTSKNSGGWSIPGMAPSAFAISAKSDTSYCALVTSATWHFGLCDTFIVLFHFLYVLILFYIFAASYLYFNSIYIIIYKFLQNLIHFVNWFRYHF